MKYSIEVANAERLNGLTDFVISELKRHFAVWSAEDGGTAFSFKVISNSLVFSTDSEYLMAKWMDIERPFIDYLLTLTLNYSVVKVENDMVYALAA